MWSYSTSNPQRPQTKEAIQEFHSRPPACQMCRLKCVSTLLMSSLQEARSRGYFKDESRSMCVLGVGGAYLILMLVACLIWQGGWKKWKQGNSSGLSNLWSWRPQKTQQRRQKPQVGGSKYSRTLAMGTVGTAQGTMRDASKTENAFALGWCQQDLKTSPLSRSWWVCLMCGTHLSI